MLIYFATMLNFFLASSKLVMPEEYADAHAFFMKIGLLYNMVFWSDKFMLILSSSFVNIRFSRVIQVSVIVYFFVCLFIAFI